MSERSRWQIIVKLPSDEDTFTEATGMRKANDMDFEASLYYCGRQNEQGTKNIAQTTHTECLQPSK
jgi:hypothetical protein